MRLEGMIVSNLICSLAGLMLIGIGPPATSASIATNFRTVIVKIWPISYSRAEGTVLVGEKLGRTGNN
jgi:hypothetical protein